MAVKKNRQEVILVVDDSPDTLEMLHRSIEYMGFSVYSCESAQEAIDILKEKHIDLVITDYHMPFIGGINVIRHVRENYKNTEVMMITGYASVEGAVEAIKAGAEEYLAKPFTDEELQQAIERSLEKLAIRAARNEMPERNISNQYSIIGESEKMKKIFDSIKRAASGNLPVLISGEHGTGRQLVAKAIHFESPNSASPFIHLSIRGIPESNLDSQIFGHIGTEGEEGKSDKKIKHGFLEMAQDGTVFFDEISLMPPATQVKLLSALTESEITYVGDNVPRKIQCRIIASTSKDLLSLVRKGLLREDLFFKINVVNISMPPLRERGKDIILLANHFIAEICSETGREKTPAINEAASRCLLEYSWPGNIRELEIVIRQVMQKIHADVIEIADLPPYMRFNLPEENRLNKTLLEAEREHIKDVLLKAGGNKTKAAELLGIDRKTLREKLSKQISPGENRIKKSRSEKPGKTQ